jgi:hypothetical protein
MLSPLRYLVKIKHQIKLTHIAKVLIEHLDEQMDGFESHQLIVAHVDA